MNTKLTRLNRKNRRGQGMTEYIIIVALIAIAAIGVITTFGDSIRHIFDASNNALTGDTAAANGAQKYGTKTNTLSTFGDSNQGK